VFRERILNTGQYLMQMWQKKT